MSYRKLLNLFISLVVVAALVSGPINVTAMPAGPTDESKVPHYFGPYPNWANSPFTLPDATVIITVASGCSGSGAAAEATVGAGGAITGITVTSPGNDYAASGRCAPQIGIVGSGSGAEARATVTRSGAVVAVVVDTQGSHYI
ncbi:MAG TPA: hypothetical protein VJL34_08075, partial [Anaerolineales bacterium]|nr:hypothetical protein [Anaerolineales bacterium]